MPEAYLLSLHHSSPPLASFSSSKHREITEVSRGEAATGALVGIPVVVDPIEVQHQKQGTTHLKVEKAHAA